ncbi:hypothetical protein MRB53_041471 [Persea americana]|nr:hypothetical protein MRB53_041471 [Persea americana]
MARSNEMKQSAATPRMQSKNSSIAGQFHLRTSTRNCGILPEASQDRNNANETAHWGDSSSRQRCEHSAQYLSPKRKAKKQVNYAESDDEEDEVSKPWAGNRRAAKRRRITARDDTDDEFGIDDDEVVAMEEGEPNKRFRYWIKGPPTEEALIAVAAVRISETSSPIDSHDQVEDTELPTTSTAQQWRFDPDAPSLTEPRKRPTSRQPKATTAKPKAHKTEPSERHPWLASVLDADRNPPEHPDYDPRSPLYTPAFFQAVVQISSSSTGKSRRNLWIPLFFFKKGKFYELYENDATIGHQEFDLKLTDRVNMRMVGVPESNLDYWANQFVAKGYKVARVDQMRQHWVKI